MPTIPQSSLALLYLCLAMGLLLDVLVSDDTIFYYIHYYFTCDLGSGHTWFR